MRISGVVFSVLLAAPAAAQPLITLAPPPAPIYGPRTVVPAHVACMDLLVPAHQTPPLHIVAPHGPALNELVSRNSVVVLSGGTPQGLMPGQRYYTRRLLPPRSGEPVSEKAMGTVRTSGWLTVVAADENFALGRVDYACSEVVSGDYLEPYEEPTLPAVAPAGTQTDFANLGRVLVGRDRHEMFGGGDFATIDRGSETGVTAGTRIAFYRDRGNGTPLVEVGTGIVLEVSGKTAKVVLDRANSAVRTDDYWAVRLP
jgi:hypothetical protein